MVLDMKTNLLTNFDMLLQLIEKFTRSWNKLFVCLQIAGFFKKKKKKKYKCMKVVGPS